MSTDDLTARDARELAAEVRSGTLSAVEVMDAHLQRIEAVNPAVNAIVDIKPEQAMQQAKQVDAMPFEQRAALPLAGLPTAVKELEPAAGFRWTQGSPIFADRVAAQDAEMVARIKGAGAIVVGKTNTPEFGLGSQSFNPVYGVTRNPYDISRTAGGSSGGAAAALAARMLPVTDGSDTGGSLRNPASFCNIAAIRPSLGAVPDYPNAFGYNSLSVNGPMARTVRDAALLMSAMVGIDTRDPMSYDAAPTPFLNLVDSEPGSRLGKQKLRAAWTPDFGTFFPVADGVLAVLNPVIERLAEIDIEVESAYPDIQCAKEAFRTLRAIRMLATLGPLAEKHAAQMKEDALWNIEAGRRVTGEQASVAFKDQSTAFTRTAEFLNDYDLLLTPTVQVTPFEVTTRFPRKINGQQMSDYLEWMTLPSMITITSHPAVSVPVGFTPEGWPVGLQIIGPYRRDVLVLEYAKRIEDLCGTAGVAPTSDLSTPQDKFVEIS